MPDCGDGPTDLGAVVGQVDLTDGALETEAEFGHDGAERAVGLVDVVERAFVDHRRHPSGGQRESVGATGGGRSEVGEVDADGHVGDHIAVALGEEGVMVEPAVRTDGRHADGVECAVQLRVGVAQPVGGGVEIDLGREPRVPGWRRGCGT